VSHGLVSFAGFRILSAEGAPIGVLGLFSKHAIQGVEAGLLADLANYTSQVILSDRVQDAREYAENIVETVREPLVVLNSDLKILTANHSFFDTFNVTSEDTIGNFLYDLGNRQWDIPKLRLLVEEILPKDTVINNYEVEHDFPGIGHKTVLLNARQIFRENIGSHIILLAMEDITERRKLENELQKSHAKLGLIVDERTKELISANEQKLELSASNRLLVEVSRSKSDFLANMSHELRTPLNSVIGFSEVLLDQLFGPINEQQKEYAENILYSGKHLLSMINDILDLAKVESGKMERELEIFSLQETVDAALMMFKEKALKAKIELNFELAMQKDVQIRADQRKLKQIIFNLLSNAIKFTQAGGAVTVQARMVQGSTFKVQNGEENVEYQTSKIKPDVDFVEISVTDTGIGIKAEDVSKLFKAFTQLESAYTKTHEGTGIGLVLSRQLVELHGGRIWLESEFGAGSRFSFTIPLLQDGTAESPAKKPDIACSKDETIMELKSEFDNRPEEKTVMPRKILIVEDNANNRSLFRDILSIHGYDVSEAVDGQDGLDQARKLMPDLILMDIQMPGMDGMTAGSILKGDPATAGLKIIALTSFAMQGDREKFMEAGFDGYLSKPINTRELPGQIKHWLDGEGTS
jgi:two-component system CheB/CheR fusion protein